MQGLATQLIDTYLQLEHMCQQLQQHILQLDDRFGLWTLGLNDQLWRASVQEEANTSALGERFWAAQILSCLDHRHQGDGRDTWQMAGALVVPKPVIALANEINHIKTNFAQLIRAYRQQQTTTRQKPSIQRLFEAPRGTYSSGSGADTRHILARQGKIRIHLRHATRHILCLAHYPQYMSLSWVRQRRSIQKISFDTCMKRLEKLSRDAQNNNIVIQMQALQKIPSQQHHLLRVVQTVAYPSIKTKVYWPDGTDSHLGYLSMPALIPATSSLQLPPMTAIEPMPPPARAHRRSDNTLPEIALCPAIRVYLARDPQATPA